MSKTMGVYDSKLIAEKLRMARKMGDEKMFTLEKFKELMQEHAQFEDPIDEPNAVSQDELKKAGRENNTQKIHELELHDKWWVEGYEVLRVPGGWIYEKKNGTVFVPYNDEGSKNIKL
jgi:hypothetical protein